VPVPSQDLDFQHYMSWSFLSSMVWVERWLFCFVDTGGIVNHHCLNFLFMMLLCHQSICVSRKPVTSNSSVAFKFVKLFIYIILFEKIDWSNFLFKRQSKFFSFTCCLLSLTFIFYCKTAQQIDTKYSTFILIWKERVGDLKEEIKYICKS